MGAFFAAAFNPSVKANDPSSLAKRTLLGGAASRLGGGKFANGAFSAAMAYVLNDNLHPGEKDAQKRRIRPHNGEIVESPDGRFSLLGEYRRNADGSPRPHHGVDYAGNVGDPILAADGGTVRLACHSHPLARNANMTSAALAGFVRTNWL